MERETKPSKHCLPPRAGYGSSAVLPDGVLLGFLYSLQAILCVGFRRLPEAAIYDL